MDQTVLLLLSFSWVALLYVLISYHQSHKLQYSFQYSLQHLAQIPRSSGRQVRGVTVCKELQLLEFLKPIVLLLVMLSSAKHLIIALKKTLY
jgi:hypothetical protein